MNFLFIKSGKSNLPFLYLFFSFCCEIQAQQLQFRQLNPSDSSELRKEMKSLARQVIESYKKENESIYLDNLFRFQLVAELYAESNITLDSLQKLNSKTGSIMAELSGLQFRIFSAAKIMAKEREIPLESAYKRTFRFLNKKGAQEGTFLESGGHSFFTFRAAYGFNVIKINRNKRQEETMAGRKKDNTAIGIKLATPTERKKRNLQLFTGAELLRTTGLNDGKNSNLSGLGINLMLEKRITQKFSGTLSYGLYHFPGDYIAIYPLPAPADTTTIKRFTLDILACGGRYTFGQFIYLAAEGGVILKNKVNDRILFMLTPSAGVFFPLKGYHKIDIGLKLYNTLGRVSLYGTPVLETGGYSIFSLRLAYGF